MTVHKMAEILADILGDECACDFSPMDEWLPFCCDYSESNKCPYPGGVKCWEQFLKHYDEKEVSDED